MATWHQLQSKTPLYHATQWTVVIDPPNQMRACVTFRSLKMAEKYMRDLRQNNPHAHVNSYILRPGSSVREGA